MAEAENLRILLVDDKPNMRRTIKNMLRQAGYSKFVEADDGDTALDRMKSHDIDLVLCDWNMPRMTGIEVLHVVRQDPELKDLPFLMVTAEIEARTVAEAGEDEVDAYIIKPFTPALLQKQIQEVLEKKRAPSPIETHLNLGQVYLKSRQY
ncbi:MAG: response regulator, partial [Deltaproteobacteria bacterium]|nr:response regulator [Deltaproteobacteria bacterium]